jgi:hypoxanthine phosphoribosyltransferase
MKEILLDKDAIQNRLHELAGEVARDYEGESLLLVAVLSGGMVIAADFLRHLWEQGFENAQLDTVKISSYGQETSSSGEPILVKDLQIELTGRHVLIVEDVIDTGLTIQMLQAHLQNSGAASVETLSLLSKPKSVRQVDISARYIGFHIDDVWIEGYGIDTAENGRGNPNIVQVIG